MNIHWLLSARKDMDDLYKFTAQMDVYYAVKLYNEILTDVDILESFPYIGFTETSLTDFPFMFRCLTVAKGKYKVIYSVSDKEIYIYIIFDCRQNPENLKQKLNQQRIL